MTMPPRNERPEEDTTQWRGVREENPGATNGYGQSKIAAIGNAAGRP